MYNVNDVVFCISGDNKRWIGYISEVFGGDMVQIRWFNKRTKKWHETVKFNPSDIKDETFTVIGPLPWNVELDDRI